MIGKKFLKAFGWFWIWELIHFAVDTVTVVFLGTVWRVAVATAIFIPVVYSIVYSRRSGKFESKKKYLEENTSSVVDKKEIFDDALKAPEFIPEIVGAAPIMLMTGMYWGLWICADGLSSGGKGLVVLLCLVFGTLGFGVLNLINRYKVYYAWKKNYIETTGSHRMEGE